VWFTVGNWINGEDISSTFENNSENQKKKNRYTMETLILYFCCNSIMINRRDLTYSTHIYTSSFCTSFLNYVCDIYRQWRFSNLFICKYFSFPWFFKSQYMSIYLLNPFIIDAIIRDAVVKSKVSRTNRLIFGTIE